MNHFIQHPIRVVLQELTKMIQLKMQMSFIYMMEFPREPFL